MREESDEDDQNPNRRYDTVSTFSMSYPGRIPCPYLCRGDMGTSPKLANPCNIDRVQDAYWNLRRTVKTNTRKIPPKTSKLEDAGGVNGVQNSVTNLETEETRESLMNCSSLQGKDLLNIVTFRKENFVQNWWPPEDKCYHTILCLSVTKWIHLNWGDDGLILLFAKIWKLLQPMAQTNYHNIKIYPDGFQEILLDKIGFRMVENITSRLSGSKSGFDRPILAFWK
ncbi:hypothetical protein TEA_021197 [Camellia sinensis var. sinensis]|uniref:RNA methyltransferase n=1 Tax=Camellia sinensis var. sinensis TaxID=542762 RepID=A0A4S4EWU0_CAMSN|nr:hypothetical protein TEA_021197 [Camellia sinensis var. sinensis]